ncbi:MAG: AzlC family ABC transporter permease [Lachnospiraceae bacterium]|nr:AzlC family ABC transporter permease [Lachnospiraceae bacterium]
MKRTSQTAVPARSRRNDLIEGMRDGIPIALGYFAVSFTFGMAAARDGIGAFWSAFISMTCVTSAGQFAGLSVIAAGGGFLELALTQLVINLRYLLMSFSLSAKISGKQGSDPEGSQFQCSKPHGLPRPSGGGSIGTAPRFLMAHGVTDEIYAISIARKNLSPQYTWGAMLVAIPGWTAGSFLGGFLGDLLPAFLLSAFGVAIYGMFLAIILPPAGKDRAILGVVLAAMAFRAVLTWTPVLKNISPGFAIIIVTVAVAAAAAWIAPRTEEETS